MYKPVDPKANFPAQEEEVLSFWKEKDIFKKSIAQRKDSQEYVFYDGLPLQQDCPISDISFPAP